jgi:hypothetical protein
VIVIDSSVIYALLDGNDQNHELAAEWYVETLPPSRHDSPDHCGSRSPRRGPCRRCRTTGIRTDLANNAYDVVWWPEATAEIVANAERYGELDVGLADASLVALAARTQTTAIATFDQRHFRAMRPEAGGDACRLLPADAG